MAAHAKGPTLTNWVIGVQLSTKGANIKSRVLLLFQELVALGFVPHERAEHQAATN